MREEIRAYHRQQMVMVGQITSFVEAAANFRPRHALEDQRPSRFQAMMAPVFDRIGVGVI